MLFVVIITRLFNLQVINGQYYEDNYVQNFWFKKKLKEKVEQFLQVMTEYQKYQSNIGILKWDSKNNELPRW